MIKQIEPVGISLTFEVASGHDAVDDLDRSYRPKRVCITLSTYVRVEIEACKIKKDGTDSLTTIDPYHDKANYPAFARAAIEATQAYALKAQEANRS